MTADFIGLFQAALDKSHWNWEGSTRWGLSFEDSQKKDIPEDRVSLMKTAIIKKTSGTSSGLLDLKVSLLLLVDKTLLQ